METKIHYDDKIDVLITQKLMTFSSIITTNWVKRALSTSDLSWNITINPTSNEEIIFLTPYKQDVVLLSLSIASTMAISNDEFATIFKKAADDYYCSRSS